MTIKLRSRKKRHTTMTNKNIPNSIKVIIDEFIKFSFPPYTYKKLAYRLDIEPNTLVQRINRNSRYFEIRGDRPKYITLRKDVKEIYFHRDKNTCRICQKKKDPNELLIRFKDPYLEEKNKLNNLHDWNNVITSCQECKGINLVKRLSYKKKPEYDSIDNYIWEYKEIEIRFISKEKNPYSELYFPGLKVSEKQYEHYHEVNELNGKGWYHIIDDNNERCKYFSDILNYYGNQGWELVLIKEYPPDYPDGDWGNDHYLFKRKKRIKEV